MDIDETSLHESRERSTRERAAAEAFPCGHEGCDGKMHDPYAPPEEWAHRVYADTFNGFVEGEIIRYQDGTHRVELTSEWTGDMTAEELRDDARIEEGYPAWLRDLADRLDERNRSEPAKQ